MKLINNIRKFIRSHHPDKQWRKSSSSKLFESPSLSQTIKKKYVPKWFKAFVDTKHGGFYERLDTNLNPLPVGYKRLLSQCRQLYLYTESDTNPRTLLPHLQKPYEFIVESYHRGNGKWIFSCKDDGAPHDAHYDFYAHAFLILSLTVYGTAAQNHQAISLAKDTLTFVQTNMRHENGLGYYETLDENLNPHMATRRQNPHMHLFEACLFAFDSTKDIAYADECHYLFSLFKNCFFDETTGTLREFFNDDFTLDKDKGNIVEAGHHFEWVWLLDFYTRLFPETKDAVNPYIIRLYDWACTHGYDADYGGIFDASLPDGTPLTTTKRVWPLSEAIRAHRIMRDRDARAVPLLESTKTILNTRYLKSNGAWVESWSRDFKTITVDYLPATSVYHL